MRVERNESINYLSIPMLKLIIMGRQCRQSRSRIIIYIYERDFNGFFTQSLPLTYKKLTFCSALH